MISAPVNSESSAYQLSATAALRITVENRHGRMNMQAVWTDMATQQNTRVISVSGVGSEGFISAVDALAKKIDERAVDFPTKNVRALQAYAAAAESTNLQTRAQMLDDAVHADPGFGLGYIALAETIARIREQDLPALLRTAASHGASFTPLDRVRFHALAAQLSRSPLTQRDQAYAAVLQIAPNNVDALVVLGADKFLEGDGTSGARLLGRASELNPGNPNIANQLAQGLLETRRFADAEKILATLNNNTAVLPELAACILLEGDTARASTVFERYVAARLSNDPVIPLFRATWVALTGETKKAIDSLEASNLKDESVRSAALVQIAIWQLMEKDFAGARKSADLAVHMTNRNGPLTAVGMLLSHGDRPSEEWQAEVNASGLDNQTKQAIAGYGLFLFDRYSEAAGVWQKALEQSGGTDLRARAMLRASLDRAGKGDEARRILVQPFVPEFGDLYAAVSFHEMRRLLNLQRE